MKDLLRRLAAPDKRLFLFLNEGGTKMINKNFYISRPITKKVGANGAILFDFFSNIPDSENGKWFTITQEHIQSATDLTKCKQRTALSNLKGAKIIETRLCGYPAQIWYRINTTKVLEILKESINGKN